MPEEIKEYEIKTIGDMLKVPQEKFDEFLEGFCEAMKSIKGIYDLAALLDKRAAEADVNTILPRMVWKDDKKKTVTINIMPISERVTP